MAIYKTYTAGMNLVIQENGEDVYYRFGEANFNGSNGDKFKIAPNFHVLSQDMYSTTIRVFLDWVSLGYSGSGGRVYGYINGTQLENSYTSIGRNESKYMGCKDITIYHSDTTGQGAVNVNCKVDTPWSLGDAESNTTIYSNVWPRASEPSATPANIEETMTIYTNRKSDSFTHTLTYVFGSLSGQIATGVGVSTAWTIPASFYSQIPNSPSGQGTIYCTTYNGNTQIGQTKSCTFTVYASENRVRPLVSVSAVDTNKQLDTGNTIEDLTGDSTHKTIIQGISNVKVSLEATARGNSSIRSTKISAGTGEFATYSGDFEYTFNNVLTNSFSGRAEDTRGYSGTADTTGITMLPYIPLSISPVRLYRENQTSNDLYAEIDGNYFKGSFNNTPNVLTLSFKYKESGTSWTGNETWQTLTPTISQSDNTYSFDGLLGSNFDYTKIYDFVFKVEDLAMIQTNEVSSTPGIPIIGIFEDFIELWGEVFVYK